MSLMSPFGMPPSTQRTRVAISSSESDRSFLKCWMPTVLSMCHGGIWRETTRALIDCAHGRVSSKVTSDIGAMYPGRWHAWHFSWRIGATSLVNTGVAAAPWALAIDGMARAAASTVVPTPTVAQVRNPVE